MAKQIAKVEPAPATAEYFTPREIELIKRQICPGASDDELLMFMKDCQRTRLDPFARQIYSIERNEKYRDPQGNWKTRKKRVTQYSIDGFRLIAERTGEYAGQLGPEWCGSDEVWHSVWISSEPPAAARVAALRKDFEKPMWTPAIFSEYAPYYDGKLTGHWAKAPAGMLAKCAEALALRRAFPNELSGAYTGEEMAQAEVRDVTPRTMPDHEYLDDEMAEYAEHEHADAARSAPGSAADAAAESPPTDGTASALTPTGEKFLKKVGDIFGRELTPAEQKLAVMAYEAATRGPDVLRPFFNKRTSNEKEFLRGPRGKLEAELVTHYPPLTGGK